MSYLPLSLRYAIRQFAKSPAFTITAVLTLALGIGANTAIFSLIYQALLRTLPVHDPQSLVLLTYSGSRPGHYHSEGGDEPNAAAYFSYPMYRDLRDKSAGFARVIATSSEQVGMQTQGRSELVGAELVSGNYFAVLGVNGALGRVFTPADETVKDANPVAVLSFDAWMGRFGSDPSILNRKILLNGHPFLVVGVARPGFHSVTWGNTPAVFVPMTMKHEITPSWDDLEDRRSQWLNIIARIPPPQTKAQAEAAINGLWHAIRSDEFHQFPVQSALAREKFITHSHVRLRDAAKGFSPLRGDIRIPLLVMMAMALLVLAMACVNTASLLLVRAAGRVREFSMRYALGARRADVLRQLLAEGLLLGVVGAAIGIALAPEAQQWLIHWIQSTTSSVPFSVSLDAPLLTVSVLTTLLVTVLFSLAPALQFWKPDLIETLKQQVSTSSNGALSFRRTCVVLQVALSLVLLVAAGLFVRTVHNLRTVNIGFETDHLLTFVLNPQYAGYTAEQSASVRKMLMERIAAGPGTRDVAITTDPEIADNDVRGDLKIQGYVSKDEEDMDAELPFITPNYFKTLGIRLVAGRDFTPADTAGNQRVAIVNQSFARHYFGSARSALGRYIARSTAPKIDTQIVGVTSDAKHDGVRSEIVRTVYRPILQADKPEDFRNLAFYVRTWQAPELASAAIRNAVRGVDPGLVIGDLRTMNAQVEGDILAERIIALLAITFGALATLLAAIGLYGVLAYATAQRTREIGIRMALGAERLHVAKLVLREVLLLAGLALVFAVPAAMAVTTAVRKQLFNVSNVDPATYVVCAFAVAAIALVAALIPARRAASVDPLQALRSE